MSQTTSWKTSAQSYYNPASFNLELKNNNVKHEDVQENVYRLMGGLKTFPGTLKSLSASKWCIIAHGK